MHITGSPAAELEDVPRPVLDREETVGNISVEWICHPPLKWAAQGKYQKGKQNSSYGKFCRALETLRRQPNTMKMYVPLYLLFTRETKPEVCHKD